MSCQPRSLYSLFSSSEDCDHIRDISLPSLNQISLSPPHLRRAGFVPVKVMCMCFLFENVKILFAFHFFFSPFPCFCLDIHIRVKAAGACIAKYQSACCLSVRLSFCPSVRLSSLSDCLLCHFSPLSVILLVDSCHMCLKQSLHSSGLGCLSPPLCARILSHSSRACVHVFVSVHSHAGSGYVCVCMFARQSRCLCKAAECPPVSQNVSRQGISYL